MSRKRSKAGNKGFGIKILSRATSPDRIKGGGDLTTNVPSDAMEASLHIFLISFQYSPTCLPMAFGGGLPDFKSFAATLQTWFNSEPFAMILYLSLHCYFELYHILHPGLRQFVAE